MVDIDERKILDGVEKHAFSPESDLFCHALRIVQSYLGNMDLTYPYLLCSSGRGFKVCWSNKFFFWDQFMDKPDPDPEYYLREDYESMESAIESSGYRANIVGNVDCRMPENGLKVFLGAEDIRRLVITSIYEFDRPVLAKLSVTGERWAPEISVITGYDESGEVITGWSPFQNEDNAKKVLEYEENGYFRMRDWEKETSVIMLIEGERKKAQDIREVSFHILSHAVELSKGYSREHEAWGFDAYDAWAKAVLDESNGRVDTKVLKNRMDYYSSFIGHLAAQKHYSHECLKWMATTCYIWNVHDVLHAAANYANIHGLMWDIWKAVGGYWRDKDKEAVKFRDSSTRQHVVEIIRKARELDVSAVQHIQEALDNWDKSHAYYLESS